MWARIGTAVAKWSWSVIAWIVGISASTAVSTVTIGTLLVWMMVQLYSFAGAIYDPDYLHKEVGMAFTRVAGILGKLIPGEAHPSLDQLGVFLSGEFMGHIWAVAMWLVDQFCDSHVALVCLLFLLLVVWPFAVSLRLINWMVCRVWGNNG